MAATARIEYVEQPDGKVLVRRRGKRPRPRTCPGSGRRVTSTGSSAFPEVRCGCCEAYLAPVQRAGEWLMRSHRPIGEMANEEG